jgi:hypothetical protein
MEGQSIGRRVGIVFPLVCFVLSGMWGYGELTAHGQAPAKIEAPAVAPQAVAPTRPPSQIIDDRAVILSDGNPIATGEDLADHCLPITRCRTVEVRDLARICGSNPQSPANVANLCRDYQGALREINAKMQGVPR